MLMIVALVVALLHSKNEGVKSKAQFNRNDAFRKPSDKVYDLQAFALKKEFSSFFDKDLEEDLAYLGKNTRPDKATHYKQAFIELKSSGKVQSIEEGAKVFFSYEKGRLTFSETPTPFFARIQKIGEDLSLDARVVMALDDPKEVLEENYRIYLAKTEAASDSLSQEYLQSLLEVKWLEPDRLFEKYGGESYKDKKGCYRLFTKKNSTEFLPVKVGDLLVFDKGFWKVASKNEDISNFPLAEVSLSAAGKIDLRVWDESGKKEDSFSYFIDRQPSLNVKMDEVFTNIRQRGQERVTCKIGNKTTLLKTGDWIIKLRGQWKILGSSEEISSYLQYGLQGELFVFDQIEKEQTGLFMKGYLFDKLRTQGVLVKIPVVSSRKEFSKKKNRLLEKQEAVNIQEQASEDYLDEDEIDNLEEDADDEELHRITGMND